MVKRLMIKAQGRFARANPFELQALYMGVEPCYRGTDTMLHESFQPQRPITPFVLEVNARRKS